MSTTNVIRKCKFGQAMLDWTLIFISSNNAIKKLILNTLTCWKFSFTDIPIVTLELGSNIVSSAIREGVDVYFECNIKSNPWVYRVSWRHNVSRFKTPYFKTVKDKNLNLKKKKKQRKKFFSKFSWQIHA